MTSRDTSTTGTPDIAKGKTDWRSNLARIGLTARGILYLATGIFAIQLASGGAAAGSSGQGAIELIARQPLGRWLLGILTLGLLALATWRVIVAFTGDPVQGDEVSDRVSFGVKAALYLATAIVAFSVVLGNWNGGPSSSAGGGGNAPDEATAWLMGLPFGQWIVGIAGVLTIGYALYAIKTNSFDSEFLSRLTVSEMREEVRSGIHLAGRLGYGARAAVISIVGTFLVVAAMQHDPKETRALSASLRALADQPWGQVILWVIASGLLLFGLFSLAEARYRRAG